MGWLQDVGERRGTEYVPRWMQEWWEGVTTPRPVEGPPPEETTEEALGRAGMPGQMRQPELYGRPSPPIVHPGSELPSIDTGEEGKKMIDNWIYFSTHGGKKAEFEDPSTGERTTIQVKEPKAKKQPQRGQPQVQGQPPMATPGVAEPPGVMAETIPGGRGLPWPPRGEGTGYPWPTDPTEYYREEEPGQVRGYGEGWTTERPPEGVPPGAPSPTPEAPPSFRYAPRYRPGHGDDPMTAREFAERKREKIIREREEREENLKLKYPNRGELLAQGYQDVANRIGKGTRILMSILAGDPFLTDKMAGAHADWEMGQAKLKYADRDTIITDQYERLHGLLDDVYTKKEVERKAAAADLQRIMVHSPEALKNRDFARDFAAATLHIPEEYRERYLDDHYNPDTGNYDLAIDPHREQYKIMANTANIIIEMFPGMQPEVAMAIAMDPGLLFEILTDEEKHLMLKMKYAKNDKERSAYQDRLVKLKYTVNEAAKNPLMAIEVALLDMFTNQWETLDEKGRNFVLEQWKNLWIQKTGHHLTDPQNHILETSQKNLNLKKTAAEIQTEREKPSRIRAETRTILEGKPAKEADPSLKQKLQPTDHYIRAIGHTGHIVGKDTAADEHRRLTFRLFEDRAIAGVYDDPKAFKKHEIDEAELRKAKLFKATIVKDMGPTAMGMLGGLRMSEAAMIGRYFQSHWEEYGTDPNNPQNTIKYAMFIREWRRSKGLPEGPPIGVQQPQKAVEGGFSLKTDPRIPKEKKKGK